MVWGRHHQCSCQGSAGESEDEFLNRPQWCWCLAGISLLALCYAAPFPLLCSGRTGFACFFSILLGSSSLQASPQSSLPIQETKRNSRNPIWHLYLNAECLSPATFLCPLVIVFLSSSAEIFLDKRALSRKVQPLLMFVWHLCSLEAKESGLECAWVNNDDFTVLVSGGSRCHWVSTCTLWLLHPKWMRE